MSEQPNYTGIRSFEILECTACLGGEFSGNIDLEIACQSGTVEGPEARFTLRTPLQAEPLDLCGLAVRDDGFSLSFWSETMTLRGEIPEEVCLLLDGKQIAQSNCLLVDSVRLGPKRFDDPRQILGNSAPPPVGSIRTGQRWGPRLCTIGLGSMAAAAMTASAAITTKGFDEITGLIAAALMTTLGLMSLGLMSIPYRQVHIDVLQRTVREAKGRYVFFHFKESESSERPLSEFSHLRIVERVSIDSDGNHSDIFMVSLEGPIDWAGDDGTVNSRADNVHLEDFGTRDAARRYAAQVALAVGLRILDTSITEL